MAVSRVAAIICRYVKLSCLIACIAAIICRYVKLSCLIACIAAIICRYVKLSCLIACIAAIICRYVKLAACDSWFAVWHFIVDLPQLQRCHCVAYHVKTTEKLG
jgi:hypothetical protein